jgi:acetyl esterase/lipase
MSAQELEQLIGLLRGGPVDFSAPPQEMRPVFEGMLVSLPGDESTVTEEREVGGVPGIWMDGAGDRALIYLHGGGYTIGSPLAYREFATQLARTAGTALFAPDYRLAPEHPHPAALDDALAVYRGLLDQGREASSIVVAGDSAGGGLTLALLVAIRDAGLPLPARAVLFSPWLDLTMSGASVASKAEADPSLDEAGLSSAAAHYLGGLPAGTPGASPLFAELAGLPPLLIETGEAEILLSDSTRLAERAAEAGVDTSLHVWPGMPHVWGLFAAVLGEGREVIAEAGAFIAGSAA